MDSDHKLRVSPALFGAIAVAPVSDYLEYHILWLTLCEGLHFGLRITESLGSMSQIGFCSVPNYGLAEMEFTFATLRSFAFLGLALVTTLAFGQTRSALTVGDFLESKISELRRIESSVLPPLIVEGPASHESLLDYYSEANPQLHARLLEARKAFTDPTSKSFSGVTIVSGPAGGGKTFIKSEVYEDIPREHLWKFDIRELFSEFVEAGLAEMTPDLVSGERVFNYLPLLTLQGRQAFRNYVQERFMPFTVMDSLDEIHPDDYAFVLHEMISAALERDRPFTHLVLFGRPLAFREFWLSLQDDGVPSEIQGFVLQHPQFRTTGDLAVSNWNYDCWKHSLRRELGGKSEPMAFSDYQRWAEQGYANTGEFSNSAYTANDHMTPGARALFLDWAMNHRVAAGVLPNLAANEMVRDISVAAYLDAQSFNEKAFKDEFFAKWLERDTKSDDRPSRQKPELLPEYLRLLQVVAVSTLLEGRMDESGYFDVHNEWIVSPIDVDTPIRAVEILNRSGLVTVDPKDPLSERFRFEPFWFHRMLVERFLETRTNRIAQASR